MDATAVHSVSVAAVVVAETGQILVIKRRDNGRWEPPGGVLERDETILDGLRREVAEETGLEINVGPLTGVYKNMARGIVALVFRCTTRCGSLRRNDEVSEFRWMSPAEITDELDEAYAIRVHDALDSDRSTIRAHDGHQLVNSDDQ